MNYFIVHTAGKFAGDIDEYETPKKVQAVLNIDEDALSCRVIKGEEINLKVVLDESQ